VICRDELGPVAAKRYPGPSWSADVHRPHFHPRYARHGYRWGVGALQHRSGAVFLQTAATRDPTAWLRLLDGLDAFTPPGDAYLIVDALPLQWTLDTMLWNWGHPRFHFVPLPKRATAQARHCPSAPLPKRAAWLNLIEGFWKILRQRALAGRICSTTAEVDQALHAGVADWNRHPTPFLWNRLPKPRRFLKRQYIYRI
jgi:DDE superfamily endonuclease